MAYQGILVDVDYCTGCEACVLACQQEHGYTEAQFGLKITKLGPLHIDEAKKDYQYDFIPQFTKWCDSPRACSTARPSAWTGETWRTSRRRSTARSR